MIRLVYNNKAFKIEDSYNIEFSSNEVTFNDLTIDFAGYSLADIPFKYQKIEIRESDDDILNGEILFTGYLDEIKLSTMKNKKEERQLQLTLLSPLKMATIRTSSLVGTYSVSEAINRILEPLINDGFIIKELNVEEGQITTNFVLETIENCMNTICSRRNIFWYINQKREIVVKSINFMFNENIKKTINENDDLSEQGLYTIEPTIENIDYANIINFKNVRLIYSQINDNSRKNNGYPIVSIGKKIKKGDIVNFDNPVIVDENTLREMIAEGEASSQMCFHLNVLLSSTQTTENFDVGIGLYPIEEHYNEFYITDNISFSDDDDEEKDVVLQRDSFFTNLITGFKWNKDEEGTINVMQSNTALRYTTMRFIYSQEIENLKGIISDSGQIEKTIDYNEKWTSLKQLIYYGRSLIVQNSNTVNTVVLEFDKNPDLEIGDIVEINATNFYIEGNFAVNKIEYNYINENDISWKITLKNADLISTYIDMFRPAEKEENEEKIDTVILSEFVEETINEIHTVEINKDNHTLNFNL